MLILSIILLKYSAHKFITQKVKIIFYPVVVTTLSFAFRRFSALGPALSGPSLIQRTRPEESIVGQCFLPLSLRQEEGILVSESGIRRPLFFRYLRLVERFTLNTSRLILWRITPYIL